MRDCRMVVGNLHGEALDTPSYRNRGSAAGLVIWRERQGRLAGMGIACGRLAVVLVNLGSTAPRVALLDG
jgi:hypothetical protein